MTNESSEPPVRREYPARLEIDYPKDGLNRVSTAFRLILATPLYVILVLLIGNPMALTIEDTDAATQMWAALLAAGGFVFLPVMIMVLFRRKYPRWWFDWNLELMRFSNRVMAYMLLLRDEYPSTDDRQAVRLDIDYPNAVRDLNPWLPLVKWLLAIPHYVVLTLYSVIGTLLVVFAWFAILFTGRYPRGIFDFEVGVMRWVLRVQAYMLLLTTDRYPPFSLYH